MSDRVVVGIDGSKASARALNWAAAEAARTGHELEIINAIEIPTGADFYGVQLAGPEATALQSYADELLASAADRVKGQFPDLQVSTRSEIGSPTWVLSEASTDAAAIVVGSRGQGAFGRLVLGSVSTQLTTVARCPVFVLGEQDELPTTGPVVVGVDDSHFSIAALQFAIREAAARQVPVRVVSAFRTPALAVPVEERLILELRESEQAEAERVIKIALQQARADTELPEVDVEVVALEGAPADVILEQSKDAQLIVVGSHGKGLVRRLVLGSVSRRVLLDADRPVALVDVPEE